MFIKVTELTVHPSNGTLAQENKLFVNLLQVREFEDSIFTYLEKGDKQTIKCTMIRYADGSVKYLKEHFKHIENLLAEFSETL